MDKFEEKESPENIGNLTNGDPLSGFEKEKKDGAKLVMPTESKPVLAKEIKNEAKSVSAKAEGHKDSGASLKKMIDQINNGKGCTSSSASTKAEGLAAKDGPKSKQDFLSSSATNNKAKIK